MAVRRELAKNCFEFDRAAVDKALTDWVTLATGAKLRWIEGGEVPGLQKGKAWPGVAISDIQKGSLYERLGFRDGDIFYAFSGHSLYSFSMVVNILSDPSLAKEMPADESPAALLDTFMGSDYFSLAVLRGGEAISITHVLAGTPATACQERPPLQEKLAEESTWTQADWEANDKAQAAATAENDKARAVAAAELQAVVGGITKVNDTTFKISSALSASRMRNALASHGARLTPRNKDGKPDGVSVYAVRPTSLYGALGLQNGDSLRLISGAEVTTPETVIDLLSQLAGQRSASIVLTRRGKSVTLSYSIQ